MELFLNLLKLNSRNTCLIPKSWLQTGHHPGSEGATCVERSDTKWETVRTEGPRNGNSNRHRKTIISSSHNNNNKDRISTICQMLNRDLIRVTGICTGRKVPRWIEITERCLSDPGLSQIGTGHQYNKQLIEPANTPVVVVVVGKGFISLDEKFLIPISLRQPYCKATDCQNEGEISLQLFWNDEWLGKCLVSFYILIQKRTLFKSLLFSMFFHFFFNTTAVTRHIIGFLTVKVLKLWWFCDM